MKKLFLGTCVAVLTFAGISSVFAGYQPTSEDEALLSNIDTQISQISASDEGLAALIQVLEKISVISPNLEEGTRSTYVIGSIYDTINNVLEADGVAHDENMYDEDDFFGEDEEEDEWDEDYDDEEEEYEEIGFEKEKEYALEDVNVIINNATSKELLTLAQNMKSELGEASSVEDLERIYHTYDASFEQYEDEIDTIFDEAFGDEEWDEQYDDMDYDDERDEDDYDDFEDISFEEEKEFLLQDLEVIINNSTNTELTKLAQNAFAEVTQAQSIEDLENIYDTFEMSFEQYEDEIDTIFDEAFGDEDWDEDYDDMDYDSEWDENEYDDYDDFEDENISLEEEKMYILEDLDIILAEATSPELIGLTEAVRNQVAEATSFEEIDGIFAMYDSTFSLHEEELDQIFSDEHEEDENENYDDVDYDDYEDEHDEDYDE